MKGLAKISSFVTVLLYMEKLQPIQLINNKHQIMLAEQNKIPDKTNLIITGLCSCAYFALLWAASHVHNYGWVLLCGFMFAVTMVPVYSLIHEAEHGIVNSSESVNNIMGRWLSTLFIAPFTFFKHC